MDRSLKRTNSKTRSLRVAAWLFTIPFGVLTGFIYSLGFPNVWGSHWSLCWLALIIQLVVLRHQSFGVATAFSFAFGMGFFLSIYIWIIASVGWWVPLVALAVLESLIWLIWTSIASYWRHLYPPFWALLSAFAFVGAELIRGNFPWGGSAWAYLAYAQVENAFGSLAPRLGESGLSFLVALLTALLVGGFTRQGRDESRGYFMRYVCCILPSLIVIAAVLSGFIPAYHLDTNSNKRLNVVAVQGNVEMPFRKTYSHPYQVLDNHLRENAKLSRNPNTIVLWGEQSADRDPRYDSEAKSRFEAEIKRLGLPLMYGSVSTAPDSKKLLNSYILVSPDGQFLQNYEKRNLVPFGEWLPWRSFWQTYVPEASKLLPRDIKPGTKSGVFDLNSVGIPAKVGVVICFEVAVDRLLRESVKDGAEFLVVPTNNSSFDRWAEASQQLQITRFRALEYQRAAIQVSVNGISGIVDQSGNLVARTTLFEPATIRDNVTLQSGLTPAAKYGRIQEIVFLWGTIAVFLTTLLAAIRRRF